MKILQILTTFFILIHFCVYSSDNDDYNDSYINDIKEPDQLELINRCIFGFNRLIDGLFIEPFSIIYSNVVPEKVQLGLSNIKDNLLTPLEMTNFALQGRGKDFVKSFFRFAVNSTIGFFGLFDVAKEINLDVKKTNFNETFIKWRMDTGPYLVLPILGPSSFRGTLGYALDSISDPLMYVTYKNKIRHGKRMFYGLVGLDAANKLRDRYKYLEAVREINRAPDPYLMLRNVYFQRQSGLQKRIVNGTK